MLLRSVFDVSMVSDHSAKQFGAMRSMSSMKKRDMSVSSMFSTASAKVTSAGRRVGIPSRQTMNCTGLKLSPGGGWWTLRCLAVKRRVPSEVLARRRRPFFNLRHRHCLNMKVNSIRESILLTVDTISNDLFS